MIRQDPLPRVRLPIAGRRAFTLVELLIVMMIVSLLASVVMFAMAAAQETAREDRTRSQVARINTLLMEKWETFPTRRVYMPPNQGPWAAAAARVDAVRELMRMELPDRKSDLVDPPVKLPTPPGLWQVYRRRAEALVRRNYNLLPPALQAERSPNWQDPRGWTDAWDAAECLYLILSQSYDGDSSALEFFMETEIGDIDQDGMPEIHDGWGNPIMYIRWAPGFMAAGSMQDLETSDPFDVRGVYAEQGTFALFPLVFSAGPDEKYDILADIRLVGNGSEERLRYSQTKPPNNPFVHFGGYDTPDDEYFPLGSFKDEDGNGVNNALDNIHNHLINTN